MTTEAIETTEQAHDAVPQITTGPVNAPAKFDVARADIEIMRTKAQTLTITGPDDKPGYEAVRRYRIDVVKAQRVAVENRQKSLKRPHIDYNRDVDAAAKLLIEPMEQIENTLALMEKAYNDERDRIAQEAELARQQRYADRIKLLRQYGWEHNYELDSFGYKESVWINVDDIREQPDELFAPTLDFARQGWEREQERIKEEKRLEDEETQRVRNELKKQREDQAEVQRQLDQQAADLRKQQDDLRATQKAIDDEKAEKQRKADEAEQIKAQKKVNDAKRKADRERQTRLAPDKKLLRKYLGLYTITFPQPEQPEAVDFQNRVKERIATIIEEFRIELDSL